MPTFTGTSINELQSLGVYIQSTPTYLAIDFPNFDPIDYKQRTGLLLVTQIVPQRNPRVIDIRKVFAGTGILLIPSYPGPIEINVMIDWYRSGVAWIMDTP